jgi:hypothetical protein
MPQFLSPGTHSGAGHTVRPTDPTAGPVLTGSPGPARPRRNKTQPVPRNGPAPVSSDGHVDFGAPTPNDAFPIEDHIPVFYREGANDYWK